MHSRKRKGIPVKYLILQLKITIIKIIQLITGTQLQFTLQDTVTAKKSKQKTYFHKISIYFFFCVYLDHFTVFIEEKTPYVCEKRKHHIYIS